MTTLVIKIPRITHEKFGEICQVNKDLRLELTAGGTVPVRISQSSGG
jgi:hypothetical protein